MKENNSPVFYRIITSSIIQDKKLRIPGKFVRKHGHVLTEVSTLTTPNDCCSQVRLKKIDEKVFIVDGWYDFVESQVIRTGYVLIFMFTGNSNFNVNIFNLANAEINYQFKRPNNLADPCFQSDLENIENVKSDPSSKGFKCENIEISKASMIHSQARCSHDSAIKYSYDEIMTHAYEDQSDSLSRSTHLTGKRKQEVEFDVLESVITQKGKERVLNESKTPQSENPLCEVILRRSYVYNRATCLYFPSAFAEKYLGRVSGIITLQSSSGKKWRMRFMWRDGLAKLCRGWREFVSDNGLKEGDLCVFELVETEDVVLKVTIARFRKNETPL